MQRKKVYAKKLQRNRKQQKILEKQWFSRALWIHSAFSRFYCALLTKAARRYRRLAGVENARQRKSRSSGEEEALPWWWVRALFANLTRTLYKQFYEASKDLRCELAARWIFERHWMLEQCWALLGFFEDRLATYK